MRMETTVSLTADEAWKVRSLAEHNRKEWLAVLADSAASDIYGQEMAMYHLNIIDGILAKIDR